MLEIRGLIKRVPVSFFVCALLFIYPLGALLPILCEIYNRKKYAFVLLSVFMGLCAILFPPFADLYRHLISIMSIQLLRLLLPMGLTFYYIQLVILFLI